MLDINTVGTGGGSIAEVSETGVLTVGLHSAGATPARPATAKAEKPTVTDAHLVLGHLPPYLLAGGMQSTPARSNGTGTRGRSPRVFGRGRRTGILKIADNDMIGAIRVISVERGHDPRFALVSFGGAGPLHGGSLARLLGAKTVIVPPSPGVLSAGLFVSQLRADYAHLLSGPARLRPTAYEFSLAELEAEAAAWFAREGVPEAARQITRKASLRYKHQGFELDIDWPDGPVSEDTVAAAIDGFHDLHEQLYTFAQRDTPVEVVTLHVAAVGTLLQPSLSELPSGGTLEDAKIDRHPVHLNGGARPVPVYDRAKLSPDLVIAGPALVVQLDSTTLIAPDQTAKVDRYGNLLITFQDD